MNTDIIKGKWMQIKGQVRQRWARLTDDDVAFIEGNLQEAAGRLQKRYGYARDQAQREWEDFVRKATLNQDGEDMEAQPNKDKIHEQGVSDET
jgi:uncharacterized protein YjbJ (UPF0337 family)